MRKILLVLTLTSLILPAVVSAATLEATLANIFTKLSVFLVTVAGICILFSAFTFVTAGGDPEKVATARTWIIYALIGVVVGLLANTLADWAKGLVL